VTSAVLDEIGAGPIPRLLVFNKIDRAGDEAATSARLAQRWPESIVMSARRPDEVAHLRARLIAFFERHLIEGELRVPYHRQQLRGEIFDHCQVLEERYEPDGVVFRVRAAPAHLERLKAA
jgi:GTP-binding protein HflX